MTVNTAQRMGSSSVRTQLLPKCMYVTPFDTIPYYRPHTKCIPTMPSEHRPPEGKPPTLRRQTHQKVFPEIWSEVTDPARFIWVLTSILLTMQHENNPESQFYIPVMLQKHFPFKWKLKRLQNHSIFNRHKDTYHKN